MIYTKYTGVILSDHQAGLSVTNQKNSMEIFLTGLERAIRSAKVYAHGSGQDLLENIYENVVNALDRVFQEDDEVNVQVKANQMVFNRKVVYENKEKRHSLSNSLYEHGIRLLQLRKGLSRDELIEIISVLATDFGKPEFIDQDLYCLFTEKQFDHFTVIGADTLAELQKEQAELKKNMKNFRLSVANKKIARAQPVQSRRLREDDIKVLEEFRLNPAQFSRPEEEVSKIVQAVTAQNQTERKEKETLERLALMGFHFLLQDGDVDQTQVGRDLIIQVSLMILQESMSELFRGLIFKLNQLHREKEAKRGEFQKILDAVFDVDRLGIFERLLKNKAHQKVIAEAILAGPPSAVKLAIRLLAAQPWCGRVFGDFVTKHAHAYAPFINDMASCHPDDDCWEPFINLLNTNPSPQFSNFMMKQLSSSGSAVRLKIIKQLAQIGSDESLRVFQDLIGADTFEDRKLAYDYLPVAKNKRALMIIKAAIDSKPFASRHAEERQMAYSALIRIGEDSAYSWFESKWLEQPKGLFKSKALNEKRADLAMAAGLVRPDFIEKILETTPFESLSEELQGLVKRVLLKLQVTNRQQVK